MRVTVSRKAHFNAAHRLYRKDWTMEKNQEVFGKCNNPNFHGHNYDLIVSVTGEVDQETGYVIDTKILSDLIKLHIEKRLKNDMKPNPKTADSIEAAYQKLLIRKYRFTANYAVTHGEYEIAPYIAISEIADITIPYLDTIQKSMKPKVAQSKYGKMLTQYIIERKASEKK